MADQSDISDRTIELHLTAAIKRAKQPVDKLPFTGYCHYCHEPVTQAPFCSPECRDDYAWYQRCRKA